MQASCDPSASSNQDDGSPVGTLDVGVNSLRSSSPCGYRSHHLCVLEEDVSSNTSSRLSKSKKSNLRRDRRKVLVPTAPTTEGFTPKLDKEISGKTMELLVDEKVSPLTRQIRGLELQLEEVQQQLADSRQCIASLQQENSQFLLPAAIKSSGLFGALKTQRDEARMTAKVLHNRLQSMRLNMGLSDQSEDDIPDWSISEGSSSSSSYSSVPDGEETAEDANLERITPTSACANCAFALGAEEHFCRKCGHVVARA